MRKLSAAGQLLLLVSLGLVILGSEQRIRERAGLAGAEKKQERTEETARRHYELYENIWKDLEYFPIPQWKERELPVTFENSWLIERTYGGTRGHEGTDLMPPENKSGVYPVVSISDGTVENVGWLEKGGWRIGIRSVHDVYFYYAHLASYAEEFQKGDVVKAGQLLGYMGDTGYGKQEGTSGQFPVHLHLGIYLRSEEFQELAVNPYWFLRYLEQERLTVSQEDP